MSNQVEVDTDALAREAAAAVAGAPPAELPGIDPSQAGEGAAPGALVPAESWSGVVESVTPLLREIVFAQWVVTPGQWVAWEKGLIRSMDQCFPGGIEGKYGGFVQAGLIMAGVTVANVVSNGGKLPPLGPPRRAVQKTEAAVDTERAAA